MKKSNKDYNGSFYLKDGQVFEIDLQNLTKNVIVIKPLINGKTTTRLIPVMKHSHKVLLIRYLDKINKFLFEIYKVGGSSVFQKSTENSGNMVVKFYKDKQITKSVTYTKVTTSNWFNNNHTVYSICNNTLGVVNVNNLFSTSCGTVSSNLNCGG